MVQTFDVFWEILIFHPETFAQGHERSQDPTLCGFNNNSVNSTSHHHHGWTRGSTRFVQRNTSSLCRNMCSSGFIQHTKVINTSRKLNSWPGHANSMCGPSPPLASWLKKDWWHFTIHRYRMKLTARLVFWCMGIQKCPSQVCLVYNYSMHTG